MVLLLLLLASDLSKGAMAAMVAAAKARGARLQADLGLTSFSKFYPLTVKILLDTLKSYGLCPQVCPLIPVFCPIYFALYTALYTENNRIESKLSLAGCTRWQRISRQRAARR